MTGSPTPIRVLVVAGHPLRLDDLGLDDHADIEVAGPVRRLASLARLISEFDPHVGVVDTTFAEGAGFTAMEMILEDAPSARVLALTPDPPPLEDVALAMRSGASGFIDVDLEPDECEAAIRAIHRGDQWLPPAQTKAVLQAVGDDLGVTTAERRSRLTAIVLGAIPLAGLLAAILSLLWRRYLGHIGVRPVDLAVDPGARVVDMVVGLLFVSGAVGPFLFIGSWLDLIRTRSEDRAGLRWLTTRPVLAWGALLVVTVASVGFLVLYADLVLALFVGPTVVIAVIAAMLDLTSGLPPAMRLTRFHGRRFAIVTIVGGFALLVVLSTEALVWGPGFGSRGVDGLLVHRLIGFRAQPVLVIDADGERDPCQLLYLGGNADLYVLVDPCHGDDVEMISVGSSRLEVIDRVTCPADAS